MKRISDVLQRISSVVSGVTFTAVVLLIGSNVFMRLFHLSFAWIEELAYVLFTWCVFFGASLIYGKQGLICIDVLVDHLPKGAQKACAFLTDILLLVVNVCLVIWCISLMQQTSRITPMLRISYVYVYLGILISLIFSVYYSVQTLIYRAQGKKIDVAAIEDRA